MKSAERFCDRVALVTGGGRGIGGAIVLRLRAEGACVHVLDREYPETDTEEPQRIYRHIADVTNRSQVEQILERILELSGRIDVLVNNAGIVRDNVIWRMPEEDFDAVLAVNLKGPWLMCRAVAPIMRQQQYGRIVNMSSRSWLGNFGQSNYSAAKGGLVSLTRTLALELARFNVTVNAVAPGFVDTPMTRSLKREVQERLAANLPGRKPIRAEEVAAAVAFLASDEAAFITGQVLHVDGGNSMGAVEP